MILNSHQIKEAIALGKITFDPNLDGFQLQPNSIDLRVGWSFYVPETWEYTDAGRIAIRADYLDIQKNRQYFKLIKLKGGQYFEILPGEFIIISTLEKIKLNAGDISAMLSPRSSVIRRGLSIEGGVVDAYFDGHLTIPVINNSNHSIKLYPGERVVQLVLHKLSSELTREEAVKHGLSDAKYMSSTPYGLEARSDSADEIDIVKRGALDELKNKYPV